jgi:hypothetical protein
VNESFLKNVSFRWRIQKIADSEPWRFFSGDRSSDSNQKGTD